MTHVVQLGDRGRMVLPSELRKELGLQAGDLLLLVPEADGSVRLVRAESVVQATRGLYRTIRGSVDDFLQQRKADSADE